MMEFSFHAKSKKKGRKFLASWSESNWNMGRKYGLNRILIDKKLETNLK